MAKDQGSDAIVDETTAYVYDANDRLTSETKDSVNNADDRHTVYTYDNTTQIGKTVHDGLDDTATVLETHTFAYDAMGRMTKATIVKGGTTTVTDYVYNHAGFRVKQTVTIDGGTAIVTEYLADANNHTGYTQVLEERVDGVLHRTFTLGHDVLTQADTAAVATGTAIHHLLYDGHGSTRAVLDAAVAFVQRYAYTAYGVMLDNATLTTAASAVTSLLYSGEWTNANGVQYLRARWYDPASGRFNRLDPFAGDLQDPQSLHKYLYTHGNPVMGIDPSGNLEVSITGLLSAIAITTILVAIPDPGDFITSAVESLVTAYSVNLEWDVRWALKWGASDTLHSRTDNLWILSALGVGLYNAFEIGIPFTDLSFNPLDGFYSVSKFSSSSSLSRKSVNGFRKPGRGAKFHRVRSAHSERRTLYDLQGNEHKVNIYDHPEFSRKFIDFDEDTIRLRVKITPQGSSPKDIAEANRKFGMDPRYDWSDTFGEPHTWHHDVDRGVMFLVPREVHKRVGHLGGNKTWYTT